MPHLSSNIPSTILYGSIFSELLQIANCTLRINYFIPRPSDSFSIIITKGRKRAKVTKQQRKAFHRYPTALQKFGKTHEEININTIKDT